MEVNDCESVEMNVGDRKMEVNDWEAEVDTRDVVVVLLHRLYVNK